MFMIKEDTKPYYPLVSTISYNDTLYSSSFKRNGGGVPMDLPFQDLAHSIQLLGSCNGLICIMFQTCMVNELVNVPVIWNPTTREYKILPNSQTRFTNCCSSIYSFGYDRKNDDYKLLKGEFSRDGSVTLPPSEEVHVCEAYSLLSDSWRSIETNMPYHMLKYIPYDTVSGVLVNGLRHWLARRMIFEKELQQESIISFDFSEDKFKQMHLPKAFMKNSTYCFARTVGVLDECLCVIDGVWEPRYQLEIWVMQDYGVPESWTKRFVIPRTQAGQPFGLNSLRVIWSFKDGKILLLEDTKKLVLYDTKQHTVTSSSATIHGEENYVQSLISLNSGIYVGSCREYANILNASWTKKLRLFNYETLVELLVRTLVGLWLAMGSSIFFRNQTMRNRFGQFVMVLCWLNSGEFKLWWWRVNQPAESTWWIRQRLLVKVENCSRSAL